MVPFQGKPRSFSGEIFDHPGSDWMILGPGGVQAMTCLSLLPSIGAETVHPVERFFQNSGLKGFSGFLLGG